VNWIKSYRLAPFQVQVHFFKELEEPEEDLPDPDRGVDRRPSDHLSLTGPGADRRRGVFHDAGCLRPFMRAPESADVHLRTNDVMIPSMEAIVGCTGVSSLQGATEPQISPRSHRRSHSPGQLLFAGK